MPSNYPGSLDAFTTGVLTGIVSGTDHGNKADALNKIEAELGTDPSGAYATVKAFLDSLGTGGAAVGTIFSVKDVAYGALGDNSNDDTAEIQAAIAACSAAGGGVVWVPEGTYLITATLTVPSNVTVQGVGHASIIKRTGATTGKVFENSDLTSGNTDIAIRDLTVDRTDGADALDVYDDAIHFRYVNRAVVEGCRVRGAMKGLHWQSCSGRVVNNFFDSFRDNAIAINDATGVGMGSAADQRVIVAHNDIKQTAATVAAAGSSPIIVTQSNTIVASNEIESTVALAGYGVEIANPTTDANDVTVANNRLVGAAILIGNGDRHKILGNKLTDGSVAGSSRILSVPTGGGAAITQALVEGNTLHGAVSSQGNLRVQTSPYSVIRGNYLSGGARLKVQADETIVEDNVVKDTANAGITVESCTRAIVRGNLAQDCGQDAAGSNTTKIGYLFDTLTTPTLVNNVAVSSKAPTNEMRNGFYINASTDITWRENRSRGHTLNNVTTTGTPTYARDQNVPTVASASTIALPDYADLILISGTTNITSITATGQTSRLVQLKFASALTVVSGSNLLLVGGDFRTATDSVLTLVCSGANWHEVSRTESRGIRLPVRVASTADVTLTAPGATIDGVTMASGDRMLLKDQTAAAANGIYIWNGAASTATRATDADTSAKLTDSLLVTVDEGTFNADTIWTLQTAKPITLGTTVLRFLRLAPPYNFATRDPWSHSGSAIAATMDRNDIGSGIAQTAITAICSFHGGMVVPAGRVLTNINAFCTAAGSGAVTLFWWALVRQSDRVVLQRTANSTTLPTVDAVHTRALQAAITLDYDTPCYIALATQVATTSPSFAGVTGLATSNFSAPILTGNSATTPTATPPTVGAVLGAPAAGNTGRIHCWLS